MTHPQFSRETLQAAKDFLTQEARDGRTYPRPVLVEVVDGLPNGLNHERWAMSVPTDEMTRRVDEYMRRNNWPNADDEWNWNGSRDHLSHAVFVCLRGF